MPVTHDLVIGYVALREAARQMRALRNNYLEIQELKAQAPANAGGATIPMMWDLTELVPERELDAIGYGPLTAALSFYTDIWRRPLSDALSNMDKLATFYENVADAWFLADAQSAAKITGLGGMTPGGHQGAMTAHNRATGTWARQLWDYYRRKAELDAQRAAHPEDPHAGLVRTFDAAGNPVWSELGPPPAPPVGPYADGTETVNGRTTTTAVQTGPTGLQSVTTTTTTPQGVTETTVRFDANGQVNGVTTTLKDSGSAQQMTTVTTYTDAGHYTTATTGPDNRTTTTTTVVTGDPQGEHTIVSTSKDPDNKTSTSTVTITDNPDGTQNVHERTVGTDGKVTEENQTRPAPPGVVQTASA